MVIWKEVWGFLDGRGFGGNDLTFCFWLCVFELNGLGFRFIVILV